MCLAKEANGGTGSLLGSLEAQVSPGPARNETLPTLNEPNRQQRSLAIGQDNPISHHHSDQRSSTQSQQLVGVFSRARALNALLFVGHLLALISSIDHEQLGQLLARTRTLNFQNFQSRALRFKHNLPPPSLPQPSGHSLSNFWSMQNQAKATSGMEIRVDSARTQTGLTKAIEWDIHYRATSCRPDAESSSPSRKAPSLRAEQISGCSASSTARKPRLLASDESASPLHIAANIRYYLLIVTLVDIIANRDWRRLKRALAGAMQSNEGQFGRALETSSSLAGMSSEACRRGPTRTALARLVGSVSSLLLQSPKHLFQITQVALLMVFPLQLESPLGGLISLMSPLNTLNQMVRFALETYQAHCFLKLTRNQKELAERELLQDQNRVTSTDDNTNSNHSDLAHSNRSTILNPLGFKRYLLISQIAHLKMTILALLIQLDLKPYLDSLELLTIIVCLIQTLWVMFATFNEFHTLHSRNSSRDKLDGHNQVKID